MTGEPRVSRVRKHKPAYTGKPKQHTLFGNGRGMSLQAEEVLQIGIVGLSRTIAPQLTLVHAPNELARDPQTRILQTRLGMLADVTDIIAFGPDRFVGFVEVKTPGNYPRPGQRHFMRLMESYGFVTAVAKSEDDLRNFYAAHGIRTREALLPRQEQLL